MFTSVDVDVGVVAVQSGHTLKQPDASSPTACEHCSVGYRALRDVWVGHAASYCPRAVVVGKMKCVTSPKGGVLVTSSWAVNPVGGYTAVSVTHGQCDVRTWVIYGYLPSLRWYSLRFHTEGWPG